MDKYDWLLIEDLIMDRIQLLIDLERIEDAEMPTLVDLLDRVRLEIVKE